MLQNNTIFATMLRNISVMHEENIMTKGSNGVICNILLIFKTKTTAFFKQFND